jgi:hypothetical protein
MKKLFIAACIFSIAAFAATESQAQNQGIRVEVTSNAPAGGVAITPLWVGFHDGSFDVFDAGATASAGLEEVAESGSTAGISGEFLAAFGSGVDVTLGSPDGPPPIQPGETVTSAVFNIDRTDNQFFSYASMILPSSDYFIANGAPTAFDLSSIFGTQNSISFDLGGTVWDAGTEVNDFATSPGNPLFGIPAGDGALGEVEGGTIAAVTSDPYSGFLNQPTGVDFGPLDFTDAGQYPNGIVTVTFTAVPEPTSLGILSLGLGGLFLRRRRS